ncbi:hypothetical protein KUR41_004723 [Escherichia coli]|nr:hypothetical protein [Escherichia coli]
MSVLVKKAACLRRLEEPAALTRRQLSLSAISLSSSSSGKHSSLFSAVMMSFQKT